MRRVIIPIQVSIRSIVHHRDYAPENPRMTNIDKEYSEKLRASFDVSRKHRRKLSYYHPILAVADESDENADVVDEPQQTRRSLSGTLPMSPFMRSKRRSSPSRLFNFGARRYELLTVVPFIVFD
jgi:hypothetical protein